MTHQNLTPENCFLSHLKLVFLMLFIFSHEKFPAGHTLAWRCVDAWH